MAMPHNLTVLFGMDPAVSDSGYSSLLYVSECLQAKEFFFPLIFFDSKMLVCLCLLKARINMRLF